MNPPHLWWQTGIIYQIYPRSFQDTDGDGVGDLRGIVDRLDYVASLGVDAIWLSPIFPSPMADFGYDVSDYTGIHPLFGTMADFDHLLEEMHRRGLKLMLDLVPNHTSDQHPWFQASRASRDDPKREWYIWRDPAPDGGPPNNWLSIFGGPAWTFDEHTGQYYLHQFLPEQPELNYRHPEVLAAMLDAMRFWLDRGVDGFRVDVIWLLAKDAAFRDEPPNPGFSPGQPPHGQLEHLYTQDLPEVHDYIGAMRRVLDQYEARMMVGEIYLPPERLMTYYGAQGDECHLPYNFQLILAPWEAPTIRRIVDQYDGMLPEGGWPNWVLGNHDQPRLASRIGSEQARVATMLLLTLRGTPTCYYGDELGMANVPIPEERLQDPARHNQPGIPFPSRDPTRTPMQWDASPNAGFCPPAVEPWLPIAETPDMVNVDAQARDSSSMLSLFRQLTSLRRDTSALTLGTYRSLSTGTAPVFAFERQDDQTRVLVVLNFSDAPQTVSMTEVSDEAVVLLSTMLDRKGREPLASLHLRAGEGLILGTVERAFT